MGVGEEVQGCKTRGEDLIAGLQERGPAHCV